MISDKFILIMLVFLACASCSKNSQTEKDTHHQKNDNVVELSDAQYKLAEIRIGKLEMKTISQSIKLNGMLDAPPQNLVSISAPMAGFLKKTNLLEGLKVKKGEIIASLENAEYIVIQQDYLEAKSRLEYLKAEYKRQQALANENVNSGKILLQAKTEYQSMWAKLSGLKAKLLVLNLNIREIEKGNFQTIILITSPISGYVTQVNVNLGMYVNPSDVMFKIVDTQHLHAELTVFEQDVLKLKIGQKVRFTLSNETLERMATVHLIGREIRPDRTLRVHCHLDKEDTQLLPGMYLKAYLETNSQKSWALPSQAIVDYNSLNYIFIALKSNKKDVHRFKMIPINSNSTKQADYKADYVRIQITEELDTQSDIVVKGGYDILAKMKNTESEADSH